ncbi:DNA repair protein RAD51 homolog 2 isoform X9 [Mauremys reevesii]|uniref:DNA repair protein RAD51 homolog 2 isoform X9 n=1 Tax=Mauremys reevesii TaxID=260615 RepID=UPI00193F630C|nr:DNA repair protein RAD51 homolog 2 isoform X9 [Mauremys reevesii]
MAPPLAGRSGRLFEKVARCGNMATKKLRRAGLSQELCDRLSRHQIITCRDFLCLSLLELMKVTGQSYWNVQKLLCKVSLACAPKMQTAYEMKMKRAINPSSAFLSTTLDGLDKALHGGVACGSLTEVTGPSGCGKTQFCLMMSVLATLPISMGGLDGAVIYIDTESAFGAERLVEIAEHRFPNYFGTEEKLFSMTRSIHLYRELTCDSVLKRIETLEEEIISKKVKLVIIDSVASVVRKEFDMKLQGNLMERSNFLAREASLLKYLAEEFSIPIFQILFRILANFSPTMITALFVSIGSGPVLDDSSHLLGFIKCRDNALQQIHQVILTNQITTRLSNGLDIQADLVSPADDLSLSEVSGASGSKEREPGYVTAALGNTWSHSVNTRLILQYHDLHTRQVLVAKSPIAPFSAFFYTIENSGLVLQDAETLAYILKTFQANSFSLSHMHLHTCTKLFKRKLLGWIQCNEKRTVFPFAEWRLFKRGCAIHCY